MTKPTKDILLDFLRQSNNIEREYSEQALKDSMRAWRWAYVNRDKIDLDYIIKVHWLLMRNLRPDIAGKIRDCDVWIGGHRKIFISEALIKDQLEKFIHDMGVSRLANKENFAKRCHINFEEIHGFVDGNGRTGRILYNIHRLKLGLPIHVICGWKDGDKKYHPEQDAYYQWFRK